MWIQFKSWVVSIGLPWIEKPFEEKFCNDGILSMNKLVASQKLISQNLARGWVRQTEGNGSVAPEYAVSSVWEKKIRKEDRPKCRVRDRGFRWTLWSKQGIKWKRGGDGINYQRSNVCCEEGFAVDMNNSATFWAAIPSGWLNDSGSIEGETVA